MKAGRIVKTATFDRRADAQQFEASWKARVSLGASVARSDLQSRSVDWWSDRYLTTKHFEKFSTLKREQSLLRNHVLPEFGALPAGLVSKSEVKSWVVSLTRSGSPNTARLALGVLRRVLDVAVDDHAIAENPAQGVKVSGVRPGTARVLTYEEIRLIADEIEQLQHRVLFKFLVFTGLRWGEAVALTWADLTDGSKVIVNKARELAQDGGWVLGSTKTHANREVPLPSFLVGELGCLWQEQQGSDESQWWLSSQNDASLVFPSKRGSYLDGSNWSKRVLALACQRAGVARVTPHQLRDAYISLSLSAGAVLTAVSENVGHSSVAVTLNHYAAGLADDRQEVAILLEEHMAGRKK